MTLNFHGVALCSRRPDKFQCGSLLGHLNRVLQECPFCELCGPFCCNWVLLVIGLFIQGNPQAGWLWGLTLTSVGELLCSCLPHRAEFFSARFGACQDLPLDVLLVKLIGSCSDTVWSWPLGVLVLDFLEGTLVQPNVKCWLWLALGNLFGATSDPQPVTTSSGPGCTRESPSCGHSHLLLALVLGADHQKSQGTQRYTFICLCLLATC